MNYFRGSFIVTIIGLVIAFFLGGFKFLYIASLLAVLEVSLSFDNAVVNAKVLDTMDKIWRRRFIVYGIPIAVFGMRFIFPILIVSIVSGMGFFETINIALSDPKEYERVLFSTEKMIFAFGGSFLLMVFISFLFEERELKWFKLLEDSRFIFKLSKFTNIELILAMLIGFILAYFSNDLSVVMAYFYGVFLYVIINSLDKFLSRGVVRSGIAGFIYLEVLDASFSFDGAIGAFALTSNIMLIMIGLGIGAMFVRSLTILLVDKGTLSEYKYLEHGAHYAIFFLAIIMLFKIFFHISELITGSIGIFLILASFIHSLLLNKRM